MKINRQQRLFLVLFMTSATLTIAIDIYLGGEAEFFNAAEMMRRTFLFSSTFPLFYGEDHFGAGALPAAWAAFVALHGSVAALLYRPIKRILQP